MKSTIGIYRGTAVDGTAQVFDKQPWSDYFPNYDVELFGSSELPKNMPNNFTNVSVGPHSPNNPLEKLIASFQETHEYLQSYSPSIVFQLMRYPTHAPGVSLACHFHDIPVITRYMGDNFNEFRSENGWSKVGSLVLNNLIGRIPLMYSEKMIAFGPYSRHLLIKRGVNPENILILPPIVNSKPDPKADPDLSNLKEELGLPHDNTIVFYAGRLTKKKGMDFLIEVLDNVNDSNTTFLIAGKGPYSDRIAAKFDPEFVRVLGYVPYESIIRYYKLSDGYIHPSAYEGIPLSIIEALQCETPVIARNAGDISFITRNVVESPKEMASRIDNRQWTTEWLNREQFDIENQKQKVNGIIESIVNSYDQS